MPYMGLRTSDQIDLGTYTTGRTVMEEAEVDLKGLEQPVEVFSTLLIPFLENIRTILFKFRALQSLF